MSKHKIVWSDINQDKKKSMGDKKNYNQSNTRKVKKDFHNQKSNSTPVNKKELKKIINKRTKSMLVKSLLTNQNVGASWWNIDDSFEEFDKKHKEHRKVINDYHQYHDWKNDSEYQKAMQIPSNELMKYGLSGKKGQEELNKKQRRHNYENNHPIISYLHLFKFL